jgi:N-acetylglucosamine kinase-like BadF-type ATPase
MGYILGVDAGNTKTVAVVCRADGTVCGYGRSGCGDIYGAGSPEAAFKEIGRSVQDALRVAGITEKDLLAGSFSMAGADWPDDYECIKSGVLNYGWGRHTVVWNDALGGLRAGSPDGNGVGIILGTGTAVGARSPAGEVWHCSFWAQDLTSANLMKSACNAVFKAELGIVQPTSLTGRILTLFGKTSVADVLYSLTGRHTAGVNPPISKIIVALCDEAENGDPAALEIIRSFCDECTKYAMVAANRVKYSTDQSFYLVLSGGMLKQPSTYLRDEIVKRFLDQFPNAVPVAGQVEPIVGAVYWGFDACKYQITTEITRNLLSTMPDVGFFSTI